MIDNLYYNMKNKFETVLTQKQPFSLIKYEASIDITQKLQAYEKAKESQRQSDYRPSPQDVLNIMLPPRQWKNQHHHFFMQYVSHQKSQRQDVQELKVKLEQTLLAMQARTEGLCPIRQFLFNQLFDELMRQTTIDSNERGLMLLRARDQRKMTIAAYQTMYLQANRYGLKEQYESQQGTQQLQSQLKLIQHKKKELQTKKQTLQSKKRSIELKIRQRKGIEHEKKEYQINSLIKQNQYLEMFLSTKRKSLVAVEDIKEEEQEEEAKKK